MYIINYLLSFVNTFSSNFDQHEISFVTKGYLKVPSVITTSYEKGANASMVIKTLNNIEEITKDLF